MTIACTSIANTAHFDGPFADTLLIKGNLITMDRSRPRAEAMAILRGQVLAVGSNKEMMAYAGPATRILDENGKTVVPGFIDCHMHPSPIFPLGSPYRSVPLEHVKTIPELISALKAQAALIPKGYWVRGERYDDGKLGRHPTKFELDQVSVDHPVSISHISGHIAVVNSFALEKAAISKDTPDPKGGAYDRLPDGTPNGVCRESAHVPASIAPNLIPPHDAYLQGLARCFDNFLARGITSASDAAASPDRLRTYQEIQASGCPIRLNVMLMSSYLSKLKDAGIAGPFGNDHLRIGTIKHFHGNSFSGRTCWVTKAYEGRPDYFGIPPAASQEELNALVLAVHKAGFQIAIHSNGDREIAMVLTAFEEAQKQFPRKDPRFRIEHCSVCTREILERAKRVGAVLIFHSYMWENGDKLKDYGVDRYEWLAPIRTANEMGIHTASHSDYSVSAADPLLRIQDLVTRRTQAGIVVGEGQRIAVEDAIRAWTLDAAYATFDEYSKGSLTPGKLADFVVLGGDPTKTDPLEIRRLPVLETFIDGKSVWKASDSRGIPKGGEGAFFDPSED